MVETTGMPANEGQAPMEEVLDLPEGEMVDDGAVDPEPSLADTLEEALDAIADAADPVDSAPVSEAERREQVQRQMRETAASNTARKMGLKDAHLK